MNIKYITTKEEWDTHFTSHAQSEFLQSWEWGEFQQALGRSVYRIAIADTAVLAIAMPLPFGKHYLLVSRTAAPMNELVEQLRLLALSLSSLFIRLEHVSEIPKPGKKVGDMQPSKTMLMDLSLSEEDLLKGMHQKARYNVRLAERKGVVCRLGDVNDLDIFYELSKDTFERKGKSLFSKEYVKTLIAQPFARFCIAEYQGKPLVANLITTAGDTLTYKDGGSSSEHKNLMAPYALQWFQIKYAKEQGYRWYDFWGVDEKKYPGVSIFKKKFGGTEKEYPGTYDIPVSGFWYAGYRLAKYLLKK